LLVAFIVKYRRRGRARTVEGAQVHGHTRLELIWTVIPVLILCVIGIVVFFELPQISSAPASPDPIHITVEGHQFYWQFDYPNKARSIGTLYVPVGAVVELNVTAQDVIHSWWVPALCGLYHASMTARVVAESPAAYNAYVSKTAATTLGKQEWAGVCATCHGNLGQGGYGPNIAGDSVLATRSALVGLLRNG